jgi:subtilisin-like proprotein convertase family protein
VAFDLVDALTNKVWLPSTDSSNQVTAFSGRGPVGPGVEGDFGRFKPDLVAPGTFILSTRSSQWDKDGYYTMEIPLHAANLTLGRNEIFIGGFALPTEATRVTGRLVHRQSPSPLAPVAPAPFPDLPIFLSSMNAPLPAYDRVGTNEVSWDNPPQTGTNWLLTVANTSTQTVVFDVVAELRFIDTNDLTLTTLSNLNESLGPFYRYESGTSLSAAEVSGTLALMQEFLAAHGRTNSWGGPNGRSPALMKAMLINGARPIGNGYDLNTKTLENYQGWGLAQLPTSLHGGLADETMPTNSMWLVDQDPTNALATGGTHTYNVGVSAAAVGSYLRITLVWSDPPGNPVAGIKLVNDLDLSVTNLDTVGTPFPEIFFGNDIGADKEVNLPWDTNTPPNIDLVNNLENIIIPPPLGTNYSITVYGHRVNVNADSLNPTNVVQDYALVVSCGDGVLTNAISFSRVGTSSTSAPQQTTMTNDFVGSPQYFGQTVTHQRAGANSPLMGTNTFVLPSQANAVVTIGVTNQWHFYQIDNSSTFTNARFVIANPMELSVPRMGVNVLVDTNATRQEPDLDMYISTDPKLLVLDPLVLSNANTLKALGREGTANVVISNAQQTTYYIAIKAEDQMAAEYTFQVLFALLPFNQNSQNGSLIYWLEPAVIPDGTPQRPGVTNMLIGPGDPSILVRRVIVSNLLSHELQSDLVGTLTYKDSTFAVLNNHGPDNAVVNKWYIYDDSDEKNIPFARHTTGPGTLHDFAGRHLGDMFTFYMQDDQFNHVGTNKLVYVFLEKQQPLDNGVVVDIAPGACVEEFIEVPPQATGLTVQANIISGAGPVSIQVCKLGPAGPCTDTNNVGSGVIITLDQFSNPPLTPGTYSIRLCNQGGVSSKVFVIATLQFAFNPIQSVSYTTNPIAPITDDAVTYSSFTVTNHFSIVSLNVGVLITNHTRASDLAITLISPTGKRILLFEDRGAYQTNGVGTFDLMGGSLAPGFSYTSWVPFYTNDFENVATGPYAPGSLLNGWGVLTNRVTVYPEMPAPWLSNNVLVLDDGAVSNAFSVTPFTGFRTNISLLPTTNLFALSFNVTHAPYLVGMVGWWPFDNKSTDGDSAITPDIFGSLDGLADGGGNRPLAYTMWAPGKVNGAFWGDGLASQVMVPRAPQLDVGQRRGFSIEGWINPVPAAAIVMPVILTNSFENIPELGIIYLPGTYLDGWLVESGNVDLAYPGAGFVAPATADTGRHAMDLNGSVPGTISTNFATRIGQRYQLSFAYTKDPSPLGPGFSTANVLINGTLLLPLIYGAPNNYTNLNWSHATVLFTATSTTTKLSFAGGGTGDFGMFIDTVVVAEYNALPSTGPLAEWCDVTSSNVTRGVQFWFAGLPGTNAPGGLWANIWDTNSAPHIISTANNVLNNNTWQHVALTFDAPTRAAKLYTNGVLAVGRILAGTNFFPRTSSDLYFGFSPAPATDFSGMLFSDSLTAAPSTLWGNEVGSWTTSGGSYRANLPNNAPPTYSSLPYNLRDFAVEFDIKNVHDGGIWLRSARSSSGYLGVKGVLLVFQTDNYQKLYWHVVPDGSSFWPPPQNLAAVNYGNNPHVRIEVRGNTYSAYINGSSTPATVLNTSQFASGQVALYDYSGQSFANVSVQVSPVTPSFRGGLDEFSLYERPLSDCEVFAIFQAGIGGKYGTNALWCPLTNSVTGASIDVQLATTLGNATLSFTNGLAWPTNGLAWEQNTFYLTNAVLFDTNSGVVTNFTGILLTNGDPNVTVDHFVVSSLNTNTLDGMMHFTDDANLATNPIKFAGSPYVLSNAPPILIFSNYFDLATQQLYQVGSVVPGSTNAPGMWPSPWTTVTAPLSVISNALVNPTHTNAVALATGGVQCLLPTTAGKRYRLSYTFRGPGAVSWWNGATEPLSQRAWDLLGGNNGQFFFGTTNAYPGYVGPNALYFNGEDEPAVDPDRFGIDNDDPASKLELGDPANLRLTNAFTIEGWLMPIVQTNDNGTEQILFRGDSRDCLDPYYVALEPFGTTARDLHFHIEDDVSGNCGVDLLTTNGPVQTGVWQHFAAVFDKPYTNVTVVTATNIITYYTNQLRIYLNGVPIASNYTTISPFGNLDPHFSPGVAIGNRSRYDFTQAYRGYMDELSVYGRALTDPEIQAIYRAGTKGKADFTAPSSQSLAKLSVSIDGTQRDIANAENGFWMTRTFDFTAFNTNSVLTLQSLFPGTLLDGITLSEMPDNLNYLPEETLSVVDGEDAFGTWQLEIWDMRAGPTRLNTNDLARLVSWQLQFQLLPTAHPPVVHLSHGVVYTNNLVPGGVQYFVVDVPQWATMATNILLSAVQYQSTNILNAGVLFDTNAFPLSTTNGLFWPPVSFGVTNLLTNSTPYFITNGAPYYLAVTNTNTVSITFALGVWFDIISLTNCEMHSNFVWQAGIPRYFQFDVPTNTVPGVPPTDVVFYLTGVQSNYVGFRSNLTMVLSEHLPLPDLTHYDYQASLPSTNNDVIVVLTNTTPFNIQTNRWYVGIFSEASTNVPFQVQVCYSTGTNYPVIIPLTNGLPFVVSSPTNQFAAPPGPPKWFFFEFSLTNSVSGILFELYNLSGDADLVLQRDTIPGSAPYFAGSFRTGTDPEQIVLRPNADLPDLMGNWFVGILNNEATNVSYTLRAVVRNGGLLLSGQPIVSRFATMPSPHGALLEWNSVIGEQYFVQYTPSLFPTTWTNLAIVAATTPLTTYEALLPGFYRVSQVSAFNVAGASLTIQPWPGNLLRISWSTNFPGETLQYSTSSPNGPWLNVRTPPATPVAIEGNSFVVYDPIGPVPKFYRLVP